MPPESPWDDPPTAAQIISINRGKRILKEPEITEQTRPRTKGQARDLMKEVWDRVRVKGGGKEGKMPDMRKGRMHSKISDIDGKLYHKISAEYLSHHDAQEIVDKYIQQGDKAFIIKMEDGWNAVYIRRWTPSEREPDNPGNPGSLREMRIKLIELKTDLGPSESPELEAIYRNSLENATLQANSCNLSEAINSYTHAREVGKLMTHRTSIPQNILIRLDRIEELTKQVIIEALVKNCGCELNGKV